MKRFCLTIILMILCALFITGCSNTADVVSNVESSVEENRVDTTALKNEVDNKIIYENGEYGFKLTLPQSWKKYKLITDKWEGTVPGEDLKIAETGPMLNFRHPLWSSENSRQDIPIMVFTLKQWDSLQKNEFGIGAAGISPGELGRNSKYIFAVPARYNFAYPEGYEEVEKILQSNALEPIELN